MTPTEALRAWQELRARLKPYVAHRVASASDVDDVLQEVLIRMHRSVGQLREHERFGSWVYRIAEHAIIDHARIRARHPVVRVTNSAVYEEPAVAPNEETGDENALLLALTACIALYVARLPAPYREAVTLTELEGQTHKDAAALLGISLSGLKSRVQRGRQKMRAMFEECCELSLDCRGRVLECRPRAATCVDACHDDAQSNLTANLTWHG